MAEFRKVMEQWRRFCKSHSNCGECEFDGKDICGQAHLSDVPYSDMELRIMSWAAEHPVVYPTWWDWLAARGLDPDDPIPADMAEKLGSEPK